MLDALIALVGALEANPLPGMGGLLLGAGLAILDGFLTEYRARKALADAGALQQRAIDVAAEIRAADAAEAKAHELATLTDDELHARGSRWAKP